MAKLFLTSTGFVFACFLAVAHADAVTFNAPVHLDSPINTAYDDNAAAESSDGLTLYISSSRPGGQGSRSLWQATRPTLNDPFGTPTNIAATNSSSSDFAPYPSSDGLTLVFNSTRSGVGSGDFWQSTRASTADPFGSPSLMANVNSTTDDAGPVLSANGLTLYFSSRRGGGQGTWDLWQAMRPTLNDDFGAPMNLGSAVNSSSLEYAPSVTADELTMYFVSERPGGSGPSSIWSATRSSVGDPFGVPALVPGIGSTSRDEAPRISADGTRLYFQSPRPGGFGGWDLYVATAVPEPSTLVMAMIGLLGLGLVSWRRQRN